MTLKTSFFNKGIFKSTIKRYLWGSVLYFIILFVSTGLSLLMTFNPETQFNPEVMSSYFSENLPLILRSDYFTFPIIVAIFVPTVAALIIFRFVHSKKSAIFTHSIPVTRTGNYISSLFAGFVLMFVPVILNAITLMIISVCGYSDFFGIYDCFVWMGINLFVLFIMFSCAVFSSMITGNSFAMIVINILIHSFLFIIVAGFSVIGSVFVYGYDPTNTVIENLFNNNFACVSFSIGTSHVFRNNFTLANIIEFLLVAIIIYIVTLVLYKKRKLENAEDVAGFKCLNHIFKYLVTFITSIGAFSLFSYYISDKTAVFIIIIVITSLVTYFATEMILKKKLNVFSSYKGYIIFAVLFTLIIGIFALTDFFGYETFIPDKNDIETVSVYQHYYRESKPESSDLQIIDLTLKTHIELTEPENIYKIIPNDSYTRIYMSYTLENGKEITRTYCVNESVVAKVMNEFYEFDEYKKQCEEIFTDYASIINISLYENHTSDEYAKEVQLNEIPNEKYEEFMRVIKSDVLNLNYRELRLNSSKGDINSLSAEIRYLPLETEEEKIYSNSIYININSSYVNTLSWLKSNGYYYIK